MVFSTAISGMQAAMTDLNVIGNNIANANTTGFKKSRAEFSDVYAATNVGVGSNTPGAGVNTARVAQQFSQGTVDFTNNALDLAINGNGFFIMDDNGAQVYSRAGALGLDRQGYVVNSKDQKLVVYTADSAGNISGATGPMQVSTADIPPQASTSLTIGLNLDSSATVPTNAFNPTDSSSYNNSTSATLYDSLGNSHTATTYYVKTGSNAWNSYLYVDGTSVSGPDALGFSNTGSLTSPAGGTITTPSFTPAGGGAPMTLSLDYSGATQYGSGFGVNSIVTDGYTTGHLSGLDVDGQGVIFARFTNGQSKIQGQVALANFANPQGLQPMGDNNWAETYSSGSALKSTPGTSNLGVIQSGALESANVDLSQELVNMIVAQRNFQANAQVISTADQVTQAVINIR